MMLKGMYCCLALLISSFFTVDCFKTHYHRNFLKVCKDSESGGIELAKNPLAEENVESSLRKWYLIKHKRRPDMVRTVSFNIYN